MRRGSYNTGECRLSSKTALLLVMVAAFALAIAAAAKNNRVIPVGPQPGPSVSVTRGGE